MNKNTVIIIIISIAGVIFLSRQGDDSSDSNVPDTANSSGITVIESKPKKPVVDKRAKQIAQANFKRDIQLGIQNTSLKRDGNKLTLTVKLTPVQQSNCTTGDIDIFKMDMKRSRLNRLNLTVESFVGDKSFKSISQSLDIKSLYQPKEYKFQLPIARKPQHLSVFLCSADRKKTCYGLPVADLLSLQEEIGSVRGAKIYFSHYMILQGNKLSLFDSKEIADKDNRTMMAAISSRDDDASSRKIVERLRQINKKIDPIGARMSDGVINLRLAHQAVECDELLRSR